MHKVRVMFEKKEKQELIRVYNRDVGTTVSLEALYRKCANECLGASKEKGKPSNDKDRVVCFFKEMRRRDRARVKAYDRAVLEPLSEQQTAMTFHMPGPAKQKMLKKQARFSVCALRGDAPDFPDDTGSESGDADYQFTEDSSSEDYDESDVESGQEDSSSEGGARDRRSGSRSGQNRNMYTGS